MNKFTTTTTQIEVSDLYDAVEKMIEEPVWLFFQQEKLSDLTQALSDVGLGAEVELEAEPCSKLERLQRQEVEPVFARTY